MKTSSSQFLASPSQYLALKTLYDSFNGPTWLWENENYAWNFDSFNENNPCNVKWEGVLCQTMGCGPNNGGDYCPIVTIDLTSKNLTGNFNSLFFYNDYNDLPQQNSFFFEERIDSLAEYNKRLLQNDDSDKTYATSYELFSNLSSLLNFSLGGNYIYGELPSFEPLSKVISLNLTSNYFTGQIPSNLISADSTIILLYLSKNYLTGVIPSDFFTNLNTLQYFSLYMNQLNGTISSDISSLDNLIYLNIANNQFSGSLPVSSLNNFSNLKQFIGYSNNFYGKLPEFLNSFDSLESIYLYDNYFSGSLPSSYCTLQELKILSLGDNSLTGTLPSCINTLKNLNIISLQNNYFKKNINSLFNATLQSSLSYIDFSDNAITGEIPSEIFNLPSLYVISLAKNCFHGNLPDNICSLKSNNLQVLSMDGLMASSKCKGGKDDYYFHSILNSNSYASENDINTFRFSFSYDGIFSDYSNYRSNNKIKKKELQINYNKDYEDDIDSFELAIPEILPYLGQSFFLFDWIRSLKFFFSNPISMEGSLPECLWWLPNVTVMHFSGNGLKGSLPKEFPIYNSNPYIENSLYQFQNNKILDGELNKNIFLPLVYSSHSKDANKSLRKYHLDKKMNLIKSLHTSSNYNVFSHQTLNFNKFVVNYDYESTPVLRSTPIYALKDVCLAYNRLSGTVPESFNSMSLENLDISFNKLTGSANNLNNFPNTTGLDANTTSSYGVDIRSNRFSGGIPSNWIDAPNMNVLSGNLFQCKADHSDLPSTDPDLTGYTCGSEALNTALYVTGISYFLMGFTVLVIIYSFKGMGELPLEIWKFLRAVHYTYYYSRRICIQLDALSEVYSLLWSGEDLDYSEITKGMMLKGGNHHQNHPMKQKLQLQLFQTTQPITQSTKQSENTEVNNSGYSSNIPEKSTSFSLVNDYSTNLYRHSSRIQNQSFSARLSISSDSKEDKSQHISDLLNNSKTINNHQIFEEEDRAEQAEFENNNANSEKNNSFINRMSKSINDFYSNFSFTYILNCIERFLSFLLQLFFSLIHIILRTCSHLFKEYSPFASSNIVNISNLPSLREREYILKYSNLFQYLRLLSKLRILSIIIGLYSIIILLPVYLCFYNSVAENQNNNGSMKYSTHTQVYGWIMTSTYLTGTTSGYVLFFLWATILGWTMLMILMHYHVYLKDEPSGLNRKFDSFIKASKKFFNYMYDGGFSADVRSFINNKRYNKNKVTEEVYNTDNALQSNSQYELSLNLNEKDIEEQKNLLKNSSPIKPYIDNADNISIQSSNTQSPIPNDSEDEGIPMVALSSENSKDDDLSERYPKRLPPSHKLPLFGPPREYILDRSERKISFRNSMKYFLIFLINVSVCIIINSAYLSGEEDDGSSSSNNSAIFSFKYVIQLAMAIFKIFWNIVILRNIILGFLPYTPTTTRFHLFMLIVNNVITPILIMFITNSSSCFNHLITQKSEVVTTNYYLNMCVESYDHLDIADQQIYSICTNTMELENIIEFEPKFVYFFTCKSEFLKRYIPVFVYTYTFLFLFKLFDHNFFIGCSKILPEKYTACYVDGVLLPAWRGKVTFSRLIRSHANMVMLIQHVVILLTFGLCSPVLALLIVIYMILDTTKWQMLITRYIKYDCEGNPFHPIPKNEVIIEEEIDVGFESEEDLSSKRKKVKVYNNNNTQYPPVITQEPIENTINPLFGSNQDDTLADADIIQNTLTNSNFESPKKVIRKKKVKQFSKNEFRKKKNQIKKDHFDDARISIISATNLSSHNVSLIPKSTVVPIISNTEDKTNQSSNLSSSFTNFDIDINNFYADDYLDDDSIFDDSINGDNFSDISNSEFSRSSFNSMYSVHGSIHGSMKKYMVNPMSNQIKTEKRNFIHQQLENLNFSNIVLAENEEIENANSNNNTNSTENELNFGKTKEEERLEEFHFMMGDSWRCLMNAKWTILYSCMFFYFSMIYDSIGDDKGMIKALIIVTILCASIVIFVRFFLKALIVKYMEGRVKSHKLFLNTI